MDLIGSLVDRLTRPLTDQKAIDNAYSAMSPSAREREKAIQNSQNQSQPVVVAYADILEARALEEARSRAHHPTSRPND